MGLHVEDANLSWIAEVKPGGRHGELKLPREYNS